MSTLKDLGYTIRKIRKGKGVTQAELAKKAGIGVPTMNFIENGKTSPRLETLEAIAEALDTSVPHLMTHQLDTTVPHKQDLKVRVARNVRDRREYLGLSRREMAERVGFVQQYITKVEGGTRLLLLKNLIRVSYALETQPTWLISDGFDVSFSVPDEVRYPETTEVMEILEAQRVYRKLSIFKMGTVTGHGSAIWYNMLRSGNISIVVFLQICRALSLDPEDLIDARSSEQDEILAKMFFPNAAR
ncbi:helix-turn-helix transcriptional regulator [uncultured Ruegeria sp.]|uniref:helix-turn-helix domain-containing protein n=1 Tax=uncultured Ruegeria sp. TaxID=259304 RepID=UPI00260C1AF2|nr:helix-turn-helix transcriptional regulator [uncultured Ruegeria sp.]